MAKFLFLSATNENNFKLAELLSGIASEQGAETEIVSLQDIDLPLYTPAAEADGTPSAAVELVEKLKAADALILLAPEYNGSLPPVVPNAIAWISRSTDDWRDAFNGKFAVVGTHSGGAGANVLVALRAQLTYLGMIVLPRMFATNGQKQQNPDSAKAIFGQLLKLVG